MSDPKTQPKSPFVHLHAHSMYSLLDAMGDPADLVARAKELGYDAIALTDHGGLYGAVEFFEAAKKAGIKAIIGVEAYLAPNKLTDKRPRIDDQIAHLTLLAETNEGYQNLLRLVSAAYLDGFYYKPRMDKEILRAHHEGLIALSGCMKGQIPKAVQLHDQEKAEELVREYQEIFGTDNFFLEIVHHPENATQIEVNEGLIELAKKTGAPLVGTKDVHYLHPDDAEAQDALQCIHDGKLLSDNNRYSINTVDHSMSAPEDMVEAFKDIPEAVENTRKIADRCTTTLELGHNHLPVFEVPDGKDADAYLKELCDEGMVFRYGSHPPAEAVERLAFELETIKRMGFAAYFLIVQDYVVWAKENGVVVGPGRGSAAGSIVAYTLQITNLDPLRYGLLFERFLNPDRISMPDVDMDFDDVKRADVINYVSEKYGHDRVAGIITFGTMAARAAVRDVGRVLGLTFQEVDRVAKVIPPPVQGRHIPLAESAKNAPELRAMIEAEPRIRQLVELAIRLEGTARHASQHACGIVIAPRPLVEYAPLQKAQGGDVDQVIQYANHSAEVSGLLKMDFLGLSNLTIIRDCLEIMEAVYGETVNIDAIPLDDKETFELFRRAETTGVFQLESDGMKRYIKELKPTVFEDIIAMVALYRPGPMQFIDSFIKRKHGKERITYAHPLLKNALENTYGLPIYQEQVMQVSKDMAGFTGGQADTLRKAMGKKIAKLMAEMKERFIEGSVKNGVDKPIAEQIFHQFEEFAAYGFNKSHAACYAMIAYQTAYLKAHWPECFMAALMNSDHTNLDRITIEVDECRRMGMTVLPPDVNESFASFSVVKDAPTPTIRFGLLAIKNLGQDVVEALIRERKENGPFADLTDFATRLAGRVMNKKSLESLIRSGAMDRFGDRNQLLFNIDVILEYARAREHEAASGQFSLFATGPTSAPALHLKAAPPADPYELLAWEKELLGLYISDHPYRAYESKLAHMVTPILELGSKVKEKSVRIAGVLTEAKKILTKNGEPMMFAKVEDLTGTCEAILFPRVLQEVGDLWAVDRVLVVSGRPQDKDGEMKVLVETSYEVTPKNIDEIVAQSSGMPRQVEAEKPTPAPAPGESPEVEASEVGATTEGQTTPLGVVIHVRATLPETVLIHLRRVFDAHPGMHQVYFLIDDVDGKRKIRSSAQVSFGETFVTGIEAVLGKGTVRVG